MFAHGQVITPRRACAVRGKVVALGLGIFLQKVAVGLPAVHLFAGKLDPHDICCSLVFVVCQKKTENLMRAFGGMPHEFH